MTKPIIRQRWYLVGNVRVEVAVQSILGHKPIFKEVQHAKSTQADSEQALAYIKSEHSDGGAEDGQVEQVYGVDEHVEEAIDALELGQTRRRPDAHKVLDAEDDGDGEIEAKDGPVAVYHGP